MADSAQRDADRTLARRRHLLADLLRGDPQAARPRDPVAGRHACASRSSASRSSRSTCASRASYDVVLDRLTHWYHTSREWIKKAILMDDLYVFNNPWSVQAMEKHTTYCAMMHLGMPIPETWMVPPKTLRADARPAGHARALREALRPRRDRHAARLPAVHEAVRRRRLAGVSKIDDEAALRAAYEESGKRVMHLQKAVHPYDRFVRCIGLGPQTHCVHYDPAAPLHDRYTMDRGLRRRRGRARCCAT